MPSGLRSESSSTDFATVPDAVEVNHAKMAPLLTEYSIEFYELVTPEKLESRGLG